jgi:hypothetical protein
MAKVLPTALLISVALHLLLIWFMANIPRFIHYQKKQPIQASPVHITIARQFMETDSNRKQPSQLNTKTAPAVTPPLPPKRAKQVNPQNRIKQTENQPTTSTKSNKRRITAAKIISSSTEIIQKLAQDDDSKSQSPMTNSVSAIIDQVFNPAKPAPGITTQIDGTTKVVTESGNTYCIKPLDDWKILGPEDDMRVSGYCQ